MMKVLHTFKISDEQSKIISQNKSITTDPTIPTTACRQKQNATPASRYVPGVRTAYTYRTSRHYSHALLPSFSTLPPRPDCNAYLRYRAASRQE